MAKCNECAFFSDLGRCRNGQRKGREDVGYFNEACDLFQPIMEQEKTTETKVAAHTCKRCGRTLPLEQMKKNRFGYTYVCLDCAREKVGQSVKAKKAPQEKPQPKPEADKPRPAVPCTLAAFTLAEITAELKARGYKGVIQRTENVEI